MIQQRQLHKSQRRRTWANFLVLLLFTLLLLATSKYPAHNAVAAFSAPHNHHHHHHNGPPHKKTPPLSSEEVRSRWLDRLAQLRKKDRQGRPVTDLRVVHEDDHLLVVDKPAGVLCVPSEPGVPSLAETVFAYYCKQQQQKQQPPPPPPDDDDNDNDAVTSMHQMVVHRLGFDTSGLIVFGKTLTAVRGLHSLFRTRNITRQYEVLVAGHMSNDHDEQQQQQTGFIHLPLMRCYEHPPYMRISTDEHQQNLLHLDAAIVGKKLLEAPKASLTHYQVLSREYYTVNDKELPVTRLTLTSMTGRTHQLNCHCAAVGRPIVGDTIYGWGGSAAPHGGLDYFDDKTGAPLELQQQLAAAPEMCVHAKLIRFRHPVTAVDLEFTSPPAF